MPNRDLTITIEHDEPTVPVGAFLNITHRAVGLLKGVDSILSGEEGPSAEWAISACSMHSPLHMTFLAIPRASGREVSNCISALIEDVDRLEKGQRPRHLTPELEEEAKLLVGSLGRSIRAIRLTSGAIEAKPTQHLATYVDNLRQRHTETGTIEGTLDVISVHGGRDTVKVWDRRFGSAVECRVTELQLEQAKQALGHRVIVRGRIDYQANRPKLVADVFDIHVMRTREELPQPDEIGPIDLMGDVDPVEHLRGIENGE